MNYKMLVLDIDGTLTTSDKKISPATLEALLRVQKDGCHVVLASGRPTAGVLPFAKMLKLHEFGNYILTFNGAKILQMKTNSVIYDKTLPPDVIPVLYEEAIASRVGLITYEGNAAIASTPINHYIEYAARINKISVTQVPDFPSYVSFPVNKCLMSEEPEMLIPVEERLKKRFQGLLSICRSEPFFLEIMPQGINKAASLQRLIKLLGLTQDEIICCGDGFNDISMIEFAGLGVAMGNAQEIVKKSADFVTGSNDEDGLVTVINRFFPCSSR